ncbi:MAG: hypothetical protein ACK5PF_07005 [bacterium]|jgi:secreted PhoX family phosphatase
MPTGPIERECCGPCFDAAERTLLLLVQQPGEHHATHERGMEEFQAHVLRDRSGRSFQQLRQVPLGSNRPEGRPGRRL